jgi:DNA repair protein RadC
LTGGFFCGALRTIAAVKRMIQRQTVIALSDGVGCVFKGFDRRSVLFSCVAIGARGPRRINRTLRLIHFASGRRSAGDKEKPRAKTGGVQPERITTQHLPEYSLAMKALSVNDRPREKLCRLGAAALGDNELVAIVVGSGSRRGNALSLANEILQTTGGLHGITRTTVDDLRRVDGMGTAKAAQVLAAVELGRRTLLRCPRARMQFMTPSEVANYLLPQFGSRPVEQFGVMMLDTKFRLIRTSVVSVGTLDSSPAHPREIFREAASASAAGIVLFHNHPSGDPMPSRDDVDLTRRLVQAGEIMGIDVIDHVILADTRYFSFREAGKL